MKLALAVFAYFLFFLLLDVLGGVFYHPFHMEMKLASMQLMTRSFVWDGVLMMLGAWLLILLFSAARKRLATSGLHATAALALAAITGFFLKLGFLTRNW